MKTKLIFIPFDHLNKDFGALKSANPKTDAIAIVESKRMTTGRPWNNQRLFFLISSARHFAKELEEAGFEVNYKKSADTPTGLKAIMKETGIKQLVCAEPSSFVQYRQLKELGAEFVENDFFLTSRTLFTAWAETQKTFVMENFYRKQRVRLGILVKDGKPEGDAWNFDRRQQTSTTEELQLGQVPRNLPRQN
jgi:deoxyribodipyrimidine photolyase-related protein